jgi:hypothetical protein
MTSVTYGMFKLLCKVTFDTYQGALASFVNVLDRNVWIIFCIRKFAASPQLYPISPDWLFIYICSRFFPAFEVAKIHGPHVAYLSNKLSVPFPHIMITM